MNVRARVLFATAGTALAIALAAGPAGAATWHFGTLDGTSSSGGRTMSTVGQYSTTVLLDGKPNTFYRNVQDGALRRRWWNGSMFKYQVVDGPGGPAGSSTDDVGTDARAIVSAGQLHVFYYDVTNGNLRHARLTTGGWAFEIVDGDGGTGRLTGDLGTDISVVNFGAGPRVYYYDATRANLREASLAAGGWTFRTLDGNGTSGGRTNDDVGQYTSVSVFGTGPHVFYYDDTATTLRHAWWDGTRWQYETVDGAGGFAGRVDESVGSDSATTVYGGMLHVWYYDIDAGNLRHATLTKYGWTLATIDGAGGAGHVNANVGTYVSVIAWNNVPHVFYRDETNSSLRHASIVGGTWVTETLDGSSNAVSGVDHDTGSDTSTFLFNNELSALYFDHTTGALRRASVSASS